MTLQDIIRDMQTTSRYLANSGSVLTTTKVVTGHMNRWAKELEKLAAEEATKVLDENQRK